MMRWPSLGLVALVLMAPTAAGAQEVEARFRLESLEVPPRLAERVAQESRTDHVGAMLLTGTVVGAAAMGAGWFAGRYGTDTHEGAFLAAAALGSLGIPVGVHLGNRSRGELHLSLLASYGIGLVGVVAVGSCWTDSALRTGAIVFPAAQLAASTWIHLEALR